MTVIAFGCDHAGVELKRALMHKAEELDCMIVDLGTTENDSVDYPDFANSVCEAILGGKADYGVLVCGSGIGMSIAANRHKGIRAALCHNEADAKLARQHNDANIICLGERTTPTQDAVRLLEIFLKTPFDGGRHQRRIDKMG